jgi:hypothetical protein
LGAVFTTFGSEKVYSSGVDSSIVVPAKGKVQAGGCCGPGVDVMVGTLVTVGGSEGNDVTVTCEVTASFEQAARSRVKRIKVCFIFIEVSGEFISRPDRIALTRSFPHL